MVVISSMEVGGAADVVVRYRRPVRGHCRPSAIEVVLQDRVDRAVGASPDLKRAGASGFEPFVAIRHAEWLALLLDRETANRAARPGDQEAAVLGDPAAGGQLLEQRLIEPARRAVVDVLDCGLHYARVPRLFADIDLAHGDGRFARLFRMLVKVDLLVLDDWGPDRLSAGQRRDLMEIVEDRHGRGSILITSQLPVATWHEVIGEPTLGDAILDRIVHNAYRLELDGPSMRKLTASEAPAAPAAPVTASAADGKPSKGAKK